MYSRVKAPILDSIITESERNLVKSLELNLLKGIENKQNQTEIIISLLKKKSHKRNVADLTLLREYLRVPKT